jgi:hypothetical protein
MMDVRVATGDVESAKLLVVDLVGLFGGECVSLQGDGEVQLHLRGEINGALAQTLKAVERWLEQTQTASADVSVDRHAYTVEHPDREHMSTASSGSNGSSGSGERAVVIGADAVRAGVGRR